MCQSGVVMEETRFVFRSASCRLFLLVQMSKEMWDFANDGELHYEKFLNRFMKVPDNIQTKKLDGVNKRERGEGGCCSRSGPVYPLFVSLRTLDLR